MKKNIFSTIKLLLLALVIGLSVSYALAWTGPTGTPPTNNTPAPVNVGSSEQIKNGPLKVTGFRSFLPSYINYDSTTDLTAKPASFQALSLAVNGKIGASAYCDKDGNNCTSSPGGTHDASCVWDSGWVDMGASGNYAHTFTHNLGTEDTIVNYELKGAASFYGYEGYLDQPNSINSHNSGMGYVFFRDKTANTIQFVRYDASGNYWDRAVRIRLIKQSCL